MAMTIQTGIGDALGTDYFLLKDDLTDEQRGYLQRRARVRSA